MAPHETVAPNSGSEALPQLNAMLEASKLHQLFVAPEAVIDQFLSEGYQGDVAILHTEATALRGRAITEIAVPATIAEKSRLAEESLQQGAKDFLGSAKISLERAEIDLEPVKHGLTTIDEQLINSKRVVSELESALYGTGSVNSEQLTRAVHRLEAFRLVYEPAVTTVQKPYEAAMADIKVSGHYVSNAAGLAEDSRQRVVSDKVQLESDPGLAYYEGLEERVASRGATSVEEHAQICGTEYEARIERIAELRDDCADLHATLTRVSADLPGATMAKHLAGGQALADAINGLRIASFHAGGSVSVKTLEPVIYELNRQLRVIENGVTGIMQAQPEDKKQLQEANAALARVMQAELLQAA